MTKNVLAFDLGASSGRGMLARFDGEKITLEEVHRFPHNFSLLNGHAYWNLLHLMDEMKNGLRKAAKICPVSALTLGAWIVAFCRGKEICLLCRAVTAIRDWMTPI